jgi:hypothetical protein
MVSKGPWRSVPRAESKGRLENARAFLKAARDLLALIDEGRSGNPIITQAVDATIAYGDAVTIRFGGMQNTVDHRGLGRALRHAIGARFTSQHEQRLGQILGEKDEAAYGHHSASEAGAREILKLAERFAEWAEAELARPG